MGRLITGSVLLRLIRTFPSYIFIILTITKIHCTFQYWNSERIMNKNISFFGQNFTVYIVILTLCKIYTFVKFVLFLLIEIIQTCTFNLQAIHLVEDQGMSTECWPPFCLSTKRGKNHPVIQGPYVVSTSTPQPLLRFQTTFTDKQQQLTK